MPDNQNGRLDLSIAIGPHTHTNAVRNGQLKPEGINLVPVDVTPQIAAFRRMIRDREFDVCELSIPTYMAAREIGIPIIAIPVPVVRQFHHPDMLCRPGSGIETPKDLEGRRVGVRAWSVTTGVWVRGILQDEYGVDLEKVNWVVDDEEHVQSLKLPGNVEHTPEGVSLVQLFQAGELDAGLSANAGIGRAGAPTADWDKGVAAKPLETYPLIPDAEAAQKEWFERTGIYPSHGTIVVKSELLEKEPWIAKSLFDAFVEAKNQFLELFADASNTDGDVVRYRQLGEIVGGDPLPYGLEVNRKSFETMGRYSHEQHLLEREPVIEEIFTSVE